MRTVRRTLSKLFPQASARYKRLREAGYNRAFQIFPGLSAAIREHRQGAHKLHRSSFGMELIGPGYLIEPGFEDQEIALIQKKLRQVDVFVDVGANIGLYTCLAASQSRTVVAVEPLPSNLRCLYQNVLRNELTGVEVFPVGLSSQPGLSVLSGMGAQASFLSDWAAKDGWGFNKHIETVCPMSTLDIVLGDRFSGQRLLIKIDVEGFELQVLRGASKTFDMVPKPIWVIECMLDKYHPGNRNANFLDTFEEFFSRGYRGRVASTSGTVVTREIAKDWLNRGSVPDQAQNFVFEHPGVVAQAIA